jgi:hypothetical protein
LRAKQTIDAKLWQRHVGYLTKFIIKPSYAEEAARLQVEDRLHHARRELKRIVAPAYLEELRGTLGANPLPQSGRGGQVELPMTSTIATATPATVAA